MNTSAIHGDDFAGIGTLDPALTRDPRRAKGFYLGLDRALSSDPRKGDWMQTFTGRQFWPLDPRPDEIDIIDIAAALSKLCRYGGHTLRFYSVAEHCVLLAREGRRRGLAPFVVFALLMHDASEGYLCDIIRPIKSSLTNYLEIEATLMAVIAARFGLAWPMPMLVKDMDNAILLDEQAQGMAPPPVSWGLDPAIKPLGVQLQCWMPDQAFAEFMAEFAACGGRAR